MTSAEPRAKPDLARDCWREWGFGDFWSYMLLAEGSVDIAAEPELNLQDMAALAPIAPRRAVASRPCQAPRALRGNAFATNGRLHDEVLARIGL